MENLLYTSTWWCLICDLLHKSETHVKDIFLSVFLEQYILYAFVFDDDCMVWNAETYRKAAYIRMSILILLTFGGETEKKGKESFALYWPVAMLVKEKN